MTKYRGSHIKSLPTYKILVRGWLILFFKKSKEVHWDQNMVCSINSIPFIVNNLTTLFDPTQEGLDKAPISVQPSGLKVQFWLDQTLKEIRNKLGEFLEVNLTFKDSIEMNMVMVSLDLDIRDGLWGEMEC